MKKTFSILIVMLTFGFAPAQEWNLVDRFGAINFNGYQTEGVGLHSICFIDTLTCVVVGDQGTIARSKDGGKSWWEPLSRTKEDLYAVFFINSKIGFAVGNRGVVLKTEDGGISWIRHYVNRDNYFRSVYFVDDNIGMLASTEQGIYKTLDGGKHWTLTGAHYIVNSFYFFNAEKGYAVNVYGCLLKTEDGGRTWNLYMRDTTDHFNSIVFISSDTGFITGCKGIWKTNDGGKSWNIITKGVTKCINSICFTDNKNGYAVGDSSLILQTMDGGETWQIMNTPVRPDLKSVTCSSNNHAVAVGNNGFVLNNFTIIPKPEPESLNTLKDEQKMIEHYGEMFTPLLDGSNLTTYWNFFFWDNCTCRIKQYRSVSRLSQYYSMSFVPNSTPPEQPERIANLDFTKMAPDSFSFFENNSRSFKNAQWYEKNHELILHFNNSVEIELNSIFTSKGNLTEALNKIIRHCNKTDTIH